MTIKTCVICNQKFYAQRTAISCSHKCSTVLDNMRKKRWADDNREKVRAARKKYERANRKKISLRQKNYRNGENRERYLALHRKNQKQWILRNPEKYREIRNRCYKKTHTKWYSTNREKIQEKQRKWRFFNQKSYILSHQKKTRLETLAVEICKELNINLMKDPLKRKRRLALSICRQIGVLPERGKIYAP